MIQPHDIGELRRFLELLQDAIGQLDHLRDSVHGPPETVIGQGLTGEEGPFYDLGYAHGMREGLSAAAVRIEEVQAGLYASLRVPRPKRVRVATRSRR